MPSLDQYPKSTFLFRWLNTTSVYEWWTLWEDYIDELRAKISYTRVIYIFEPYGVEFRGPLLFRWCSSNVHTLNPWTSWNSRIQKGLMYDSFLLDAFPRLNSIYDVEFWCIMGYIHELFLFTVYKCLFICCSSYCQALKILPHPLRAFIYSQPLLEDYLKSSLPKNHSPISNESPYSNT